MQRTKAMSWSFHNIYKWFCGCMRLHLIRWTFCQQNTNFRCNKVVTPLQQPTIGLIRSYIDEYYRFSLFPCTSFYRMTIVRCRFFIKFRRHCAVVAKSRTWFYFVQKMLRDFMFRGMLHQPIPPPPHIKGPRAPYKNVHVMKTMYQNSVELRPVLLLPKAIFSLWGSLAVTAVPPVSDSRRPFCNHCCRPFYIYNHCCRPFYNRRLHEVKITRIYLIISINNCLLTDMLVLESFRFD